MCQLGYSSHDSPTPGRATPWNRAEQAEYQERTLRENIYMGNTSSEAAYAAWWQSDGHRKIMFSKDANHPGGALVGKHWTMMMDKGTRPAAAQ
jgi:uncharacterized protein YkwD